MFAVDWGLLYQWFWGLLGVVGGVGAIVVMLRVAAKGIRERDDEVAAREFYAEHGHWPEQEPGAPPDPLPPLR